MYKQHCLSTMPFYCFVFSFINHANTAGRLVTSLYLKCEAIINNKVKGKKMKKSTIGLAIAALMLSFATAQAYTIKLLHKPTQFKTLDVSYQLYSGCYEVNKVSFLCCNFVFIA